MGLNGAKFDNLSELTTTSTTLAMESAVTASPPPAAPPPGLMDQYGDSQAPDQIILT
jgi:hypothetical protein